MYYTWEGRNVIICMSSSVPLGKPREEPRTSSQTRPLPAPAPAPHGTKLPFCRLKYRRSGAIVTVAEFHHRTIFGVKRRTSVSQVNPGTVPYPNQIYMLLVDVPGAKPYWLLGKFNRRTVDEQRVGVVVKKKHAFCGGKMGGDVVGVNLAPGAFGPTFKKGKSSVMFLLNLKKNFIG